MAIILLIKTEDGLVTELPILNKVIMGRSASSDYKITDIKMSGKHCSFEVNNKGQVLFTDLGSTNGSFINNSQVNQTLMRVNDIIRIGNTLIKIEEKRLSAAERMAVGVSIVNRKNDKTLPDMSKIGAKAAEAAAAAEAAQKENAEKNADGSPKKKTIVLNKSLKEKKKVASNWASSETVHDQEAATGQTKFLKLEKKKK